MAARFERIKSDSIKATVSYLIDKTVDYYTGTGDAEPPGFFLGNGAKFLQLANAPVTRTALDRFFRGEDPGTGTRLVPDRKNRCPGYQMTLSAPKSVSCLWGLTEDEKERRRIEGALDAAGRKAFDRIEKELEYRLGAGGVDKRKVAGALASVFRHGDSRLGDPHWHWHIELANIAWTEDGKTVSLSPDRLLEIHKLLDATYQREIARELRSLGYNIEERHVREKGKSILRMSIAGIPEEVVNHFSKRGEEVNAALDELKEQGKSITSQLHDATSRRTKKAKKTIDRETQFEKWREDAAMQCGFTLDTKELKRTQAKEIAPKSDAEIVASLLDKHSTFDKDKIETLVAGLATYDPAADADPDYVANRTRRILMSPDLIPLQTADGKVLWTSKELRAMEEHIIEYSVKTRSDRRHAEAVPRDLLEDIIAKTKAEKMEKAGKGWKEGSWAKQEAAVRHLVHGSGRVAVLVGAAGAGKSSSSELAVKAFEAAGLKVFGSSVSWKATRNFENEAGAKSRSLASLVQAIKDGKSPLDAQSVVFVDEHGMAGTQDTAILLRECEKVGAKTILIGEAEQLVPISSGAIFAAIQKAMEKDAAMMGDAEGVAVLDQINRQQNAWHRDAVYAIRSGDAETALTAFEEHGCLAVSETKADATKQAVEAWFEARERCDGNALMLAATRAEVQTLNELARAELKKRGDIGKADFGVMVSQGEIEGVADSYTIREMRYFSERERIIFKKNDKKELGVINGDEGTIEKLTKTRDGVRFTVKMDDGRKVEFDSSKYDSLEWANARSVHSAQGLTVGECVFLMDAEGGLLNRNLAYVGLSRSKGETKIFTATPDDLAKVASRDGGKGTTLDYVIAEGDRKAFIDNTLSNALPVDTIGQAIAHGTADQLREIIKANPDALDEKDEHGNNALHLAVFHGSLDAVRVLLAEGMNPDEPNYKGQTPASDAAKKPHAEAFEAAFDLARREHVLAANDGAPTPEAEPKATATTIREEPVNSSGMQEPPVPVAPPIPATKKKISVKEGAEDIVDRLRKGTLSKGRLRNFLFITDEERRPIEPRPNAAQTLLFVAAELNCVKALDIALEHGADINGRDGMGKTALHIAYDSEIMETDVIDALGKHGARTDIPDSDGWTVEKMIEASKPTPTMQKAPPVPVPSFAKPPKSKGLEMDM
ncbi:MobF family relaxase [Azospira oryzae]|uniref:MobF family relaxase n=1 Tax=Azospira oryzae TaxID=146939 RepID=UPI001962CCC7|nr:MobF family relaxase [Azospira oryzae]